MTVFVEETTISLKKHAHIIDIKILFANNASETLFRASVYRGFRLLP